MSGFSRYHGLGEPLMPEPITTPLSGKVCLVTGASSEIGKAVARELARLKATVVLACRSPEKGEAARRDIAEATGSRELEVVTADLSNRRQVRDLVAALAL